MVTAKARKSAIGPAYISPSMPKISGKIKRSGSKNKICLVRDRNIPLFGFPMDVKKFDVIGCKKLTKVKNKKTRK